MTRLGIAIGGLAYPINEFIPNGIKCFKSREYRSIEREIINHKGKITLIGFSWGAELALKLAYSYYHVDRVIAHSPGKMKFPSIWDGLYAETTILTTIGDKLCYETSRQAFFYFRERVPNVSYTELPFQDFEPKNLVERFMFNNKHQFANAVPFLERKGWGMLP